MAMFNSYVKLPEGTFIYRVSIIHSRLFFFFGRTCLALKVPPNSAGSASDARFPEGNQDEQSPKFGSPLGMFRIFLGDFKKNPL